MGKCFSKTSSDDLPYTLSNHTYPFKRLRIHWGDPTQGRPVGVNEAEILWLACHERLDVLGHGFGVQLEVLGQATATDTGGHYNY